MSRIDMHEDRLQMSSSLEPWTWSLLETLWI